MRTGGEEAGRAAEKTLVHEGDLEKVFGQSARVEIVVISFADATEERHWTRPPELELQHAKHEPLRLEDFLNRVSAVDHVNNLLDRRAVDLFVFRGDEQCGGTDELKFAERNDLGGQETIDEVGAQEKSLGKKAESLMNLDEPIHENCTHRPLDFSLGFHVVAAGGQLDL